MRNWNSRHTYTEKCLWACLKWLINSRSITIIIARRAIVFATYTGVPDKKCVNLCLSNVWCNARDCRIWAKNNSYSVNFCVFSELLGGVLSDWCSCALRTWRVDDFWLFKLCLLNTIALRPTVPCRCNAILQRFRTSSPNTQRIISYLTLFHLRSSNPPKSQNTRKSTIDCDQRNTLLQNLLKQKAQHCFLSISI